MNRLWKLVWIVFGVLPAPQVWGEVPTCQVAFEAPLVAPSLPYRTVLVADLDNDGVDDLIQYQSPTVGTEIRLNNGDETFRSQFVADFFALAVADIDGDGNLDLIGWRDIESPVEVRRGDGSGEFPFVEFPALGNAAQLFAGDFDGDGITDVLSVANEYPSTSVRIYRNDGAGNFALSGESSFSGSAPTGRVQDLNGDGRDDFLLVKYTSGGWVKGLTGPGGTIASLDVYATPAAPSDTVVCELDGQAPADIIVLSYVGEHLIRYGDGSTATLGGCPPDALMGDWIDVDGDGLRDLVVFRGNPRGVVVRFAADDGSFGDCVSLVPDLLHPFFACHDLNGDGYPEVIGTDGVHWNRLWDFEDCDGNGEPDACDVLTSDCNGNGQPDACDIAMGVAEDQNSDGVPDSCQRFIRGDVNGDGVVDLSDPVAALFQLFSGEAPASCPSAVDSNDDGSLDVSDSVFLLALLFYGGSAPPVPYPACGIDPTQDPVPCEASEGCP